MKKFLPVVFLLLFMHVFVVKAQTRYVIQLKNKGNNQFTLEDPSQYLSQRAIDRRNLYSLPIDSSDLPITAAYIDSIRLAGNVTILNVSKWLNLVSIKTSDAAALTKINNFPFVVSSRAFAARPLQEVAVNKQFELQAANIATPASAQGANDYYNYGLAYNQIHLNNGEFLHNHGFRGDSMQMAFLDDGFINYKTLAIFDSVRNSGRILGVWNFAYNKSKIDTADFHGTHSFSTVAANKPGSFIGTAPNASFYLYITEDYYTEYEIEELNFAAGAERADSAGVNVISCSLGYNTFDLASTSHTYNDMNGNKTIGARASNMAAKKGMLVVTALGNEGDPRFSSWHYLDTPGDADSCLSVGAVDVNKTVAAFSSYGPSSDGQIKPDIAALGVNATVVNTSTGQPGTNSGTSFSTPIIAGMATCLWQAFPEVTNMNIIAALRKASDRFNNPNDRSGYGVPDVKKAFVDLIKQLHTQNVAVNKCNVNIKWRAKCASDMNFVVERKLANEASYTPLITKYNQGNFAAKNFTFIDDLTAVATPSSVAYRIKMNIAADTSFYLDSTLVNYTEPCTTYTFTGDGYWDMPENWSGNTIPPDTLAAGEKIFIDPTVGGKCVLNKIQHIAVGATLIVNPGKEFVVPQELIIQEEE